MYTELSSSEMRVSQQRVRVLLCWPTLRVSLLLKAAGLGNPHFPEQVNPLDAGIRDGESWCGRPCPLRARVLTARIMLAHLVAWLLAHREEKGQVRVLSVADTLQEGPCVGGEETGSHGELTQGHSSWAAPGHSAQSRWACPGGLLLHL